MKIESRNILVRGTLNAKFTKRANEYSKTLKAILATPNYSKPESALSISFDKDYQSNVRKIANRYKKVKHVVLVGIGGSSLGTEAIYEALKTPHTPQLTVIDSLDEVVLRQGLRAVESSHPEDVVVIIISKSGTTTETITNGSAIIHALSKEFGKNYTKRVVAIGDGGGVFMQECADKKIAVCTLPKSIGGRFSVFTAVGLLPLTILGFDTKAIRQGAHDAVSGDELTKRKKSAINLALLAANGHNLLNLFFTEKRFERLGYWTRQLFAESTGKAKTNDGKKFSHSILPIISTEVELHSTAQLFLSQFKGVHTRFISTEEDRDVRCVSGWLSKKLLPDLYGKKRSLLRKALLESVLHAYDDQKLSYTHYAIKKIDGYTLGFLMSSFMAEVMYFCHIHNIDGFNQPHVEIYKEHLRKALTH